MQCSANRNNRTPRHPTDTMKNEPWKHWKCLLLLPSFLWAGCNCSGPPVITKWKVGPTIVCPSEQVRLEWETDCFDHLEVIIDPPVINPTTGDPIRIPDWTLEKDGEMWKSPTADTTTFYLAGSARGFNKESDRITVTVVRGTLDTTLNFFLSCPTKEWMPVEIPAADFSERLLIRTVRNLSDRDVWVTHGGKNDVPIAQGGTVDSFNGMSARGLWQAWARLREPLEGCPPPMSVGPHGGPVPRPPPPLTLVVTIGCD